MRDHGSKASMQHAVVPPRVAEVLANELRTRILRGEFSEGAMLPKQEILQEEYQVSHPSLREALRILETEGLVTIRRGNVGGAEVHVPSAGSAAYMLGLALEAGNVAVADLGAALLAIEPICSRLAAMRTDRESSVVPPLNELIDEAEAAIDDPVAFTRLSRRFHDEVVGLSGNRTIGLLVHSLVALWTAQEEVWAETMKELGEYPPLARRRDVLTAHRRVVAKISLGDPDAAERAAQEHLFASQQAVLPRLDRSVDATSPGAQRLLRAPVMMHGPGSSAM